MRRPIAILAVLALTLGACGGADAALSQLTAMDGDVVEVHYVLTLDDGTVVQSSRDSMPLSFTVGSGQVITGFDDAVRGRSVGEVVDVTIAPEEAYGERDETLTTEVPVAPSQGDVAVGDTVYLSNGQPVVVLEVADDVATVDLNHPLAGETLHFEIEVLAITRG